MDEGALRCSLNLPRNVLADTPKYSSCHSNLLHLNQYITLLFFLIVSMYLHNTKMFFNVLPFLKYFCISHFLRMLLMLLFMPCVYGMTMCPLYLYPGSVLVWLFEVLMFVFGFC